MEVQKPRFFNQCLVSLPMSHDHVVAFLTSSIALATLAEDLLRKYLKPILTHVE